MGRVRDGWCDGGATTPGLGSVGIHRIPCITLRPMPKDALNLMPNGPHHPLPPMACSQTRPRWENSKCALRFFGQAPDPLWERFHPYLAVKMSPDGYKGPSEGRSNGHCYN